MSYTIGVDIGGTFTDFLVLEEEGKAYIAHKSPSTPADPSEGLLTGLAEIAERLELSQAEFLGQVSLIVHGTTVATNAVLTGRGAKTGLLTTDGFRDVLEMRRGVRSRDHLYDNKYVAPAPLVPRDLRLPVRERTDLAGDVVLDLADESVRTAVERFRREGVEAVAICLMHSYANPAHEERVRDIVAELMPDCFISVSSEVLPQVRLYNRASTTAMNAYVGPVVAGYVARLVRRLKDGAFGGILLVMQSSGGVATPETVAHLPATTVLSGPAAGPVAGLAFVAARGEADCIVVDMGGTSFDASLVKDGEVQVTREGEINRHAISLPMTDIHTIGAGGGSIAWLDEGRLLRVGPQSAGANPGPAAYGRGGTEPTVSDADLVLGYLNPDYFLGGRMRLDADMARQAIEERIARPLGLDVVEAAAGIYEVINLKMAAGVKDISVQRGYDPREFPLVVAGGAGPVHAAAIAEELDLPLLVVPRLSSVVCAAGMLLADLRHDYVRSFGTLLSEFDSARARRLVDEMVAEGQKALTDEGVADDRQEALVSADMRYVGQHHEVTVSFPPEYLEDDLDGVAEAFHRRHEQLYGFSLRENLLEMINLRATLLGRRKGFDLETLVAANGTGPLPRKTPRPVYLRSAQAMVEVEVYDGDAMGPGQKLTGPAVVEEVTTSIFVPDGFELYLDRTGSFVMHRQGAAVGAP